MNEQDGWYDSESHDSLGSAYLHSSLWCMVSALSHLRKDRPRYTSTILAIYLWQGVDVAILWPTVASAGGRERVLNRLVTRLSKAQTYYIIYSP